ncbi:MAG: helix-turn-helix transcriptional regulator [Caldilineaceae bacterium]|nr:helix-turn-helix transcriptional regulator [Caldilineaceae bacterium]
MTERTASRVGLYVQSTTRDRLNALKDEIGAARVGHVSQDDVINYLLDIATKRVLQEQTKQISVSVAAVAETTGRRIARLRIEKNWTLDELAAHLAKTGIDISNTSLSRIERGEQTAGSDKIAGLARVFGVSADYLLLLTDDPSPHK